MSPLLASVPVAVAASFYFAFGLTLLAALALSLRHLTKSLSFSTWSVIIEMMSAPLYGFSTSSVRNSA